MKCERKLSPSIVHLTGYLPMIEQFSFDYAYYVQVYLPVCRSSISIDTPELIIKTDFSVCVAQFQIENKAYKFVANTQPFASVCTSSSMNQIVCLITIFNVHVLFLSCYFSFRILYFINVLTKE